MSRVDSRIEEWKRKLVDLTRRNRLLFFRPTRSSTLRIEEPSPEDVFKRLVIEEKPWEVFIPPEEENELPNGEPDPQQSFQAILDPPKDLSKPKEVKRKPNELLCATKEGGRIRAILRNLHRRSRSDFQERGIRILHVAFGILEWKELQGSETIRSPLLLIPVELDRESANDPFELSLAEEDSVINPAIEVRLWNDFRIKLPPPPDDWEETSLSDYLNGIARQVQPQNWSVLQECWIGLFSFHKLVIYQDLNSNADLIKKNSVVLGLSGGGLADDGSGDLPEAEKLDSLVHPKDSYLILDADSSQLRCIEAVKAGKSLVLHGPPGTGKSQTIANLISESIAAGKSVLFVSEKMAALEVVYKRLRAADLSHYCLQLHSHKANKKEVVAELYRVYLESLQPRNVMTEMEFQRLISRRNYLNDYVNTLHLVRQPLGRSAFDVLGELSGLEHFPVVVSGDVQPETLTPSRLDIADQLAKRLAQVWNVVIEGDRFPWFGCTDTSYGVGTRATFQELIANCQETLVKLTGECQRLANVFGCPTPDCLPDAEWLLKTGEMLCGGPGAERSWLTASHLDPILSGAKEHHDLSSRRRVLKDELGRNYTDVFFRLPASFRKELDENLAKASAFFGSRVDENSMFVSKRETILQWLQDLIARLDDWIRDGGIICNLSGLALSRLRIGGIQNLIRIVELCSGDCRPNSKWFEPTVLENVRQKLPALHREYETRNTVRSQILQEYDESFLALDIERLAQDYPTRYGSFLRWFKPGFYQLRQQIRRCRRNGKYPKNIPGDLNKGCDLLRLQVKIEGESELTKKLLGDWYRGYDTHFDRVEKAVSIASEILVLTDTKPSPSLIDQACLGSTCSVEFQKAAKRLQNSITAWEKEPSEIEQHICPGGLPATNLPLRESQLEEVLNWAKNLVEPLEIVVRHFNTIQGMSRSEAAPNLSSVLGDLERLSDLHEIESKMLYRTDELRKKYGSQFIGLDTDWDAMLGAVEWAHRFREHLGQRSPSDSLIGLACKGAVAAPKIDTLCSSIERFKNAFEQLSTRFDQEKQGTLTNALEGTLSAISPRLKEMEDRIEELRDWVDYKGVEKDFLEAGICSLYAALTNHSALSPEQLPHIVRKSLLNIWIDWLSKEEPALGRFRAQDHEAVIAEFRELDRKHSKLGSHRVILEAERRKPKNLALQPGSEVAILFREANKKKRHLPIRRLFEQIPNLLIRLKPCLLMSPLSVSQFLDPHVIRFDLVIFDEASQICSEDAVGAIYRGQQLVVCGDNKQLPPTAFFEQGMSDEFEDQDASEAFDVFDSILDECASIGLPTLQLLWHYRSRHESLIAFSNFRFYDNRLVTFPASYKEHPELGIQFLHVPNGVYDRGGKRDNPMEAEAVVGLIVQHFLKHPNRSLGVVTFSVAQRDAIEDRLELILRDRPELERYFSRDLLEHCFVKNLESVQGDERDVMIFSVGYGRDQHGRMTMNFGPLNLEGGERRLNVAVTRARERVIVISSIRASDFDLSGTQAPGVRVFYNYLDYAERGEQALALAYRGSSGDFDSPLEQDVAGVIRSLGFDVVPQVGCSGFRIDLGVVDLAQPGRFILGVECDGVTYHSAYTARDRDRLRQEILERLGWRIHRIWSPDWAARRAIEIRRLREALERARAFGNDTAYSKQTLQSGLAPDDGPIIKRAQPPQEDAGSMPNWAVPYKVCKLKTAPSTKREFHDPTVTRILALMLEEVVNTEGPVHLEVSARRLADRWGLQRIGIRMMDAINVALGELIKTGVASRRGEFMWPGGSDFKPQVRHPDPKDPETIRRIELIAGEELELAITNLVRDAISAPEEDVLTQVSRIFGYDRTGSNIQDRLEKVFQRMLRRRVLVRHGDRVTLADPRDPQP